MYLATARDKLRRTHIISISTYGVPIHILCMQSGISDVGDVLSVKMTKRNLFVHREGGGAHKNVRDATE